MVTGRWACHEIGCRAKADDHGDHHGIEKLARASRSGRASFLRLESIIAADIDRAVGAPFPAAVIGEEMMAMVVMTMPKKAMAKMTMAKPVMAVASTMPTVAAMPTMTSCESLARDGRRSGNQRQSSDPSGNDLLDVRHGRLLGLGRARTALR